MDNATFLAFMDGKELLKEGKVDEGRALLKQSADAGMKVAMYEYAESFSDENPQREIEILKAASEKGCGKAAYKLGQYYCSGHNVNKNKYIAGEYFLKAFECGVWRTEEKELLDDDFQSRIDSTDLALITLRYIDADICLNDDSDILSIAEEAYRYGPLEEDDFEKTKYIMEHRSKTRIIDKQARTCPKCGAYYARVEKRKQPIGKRAAVGGAIGLLGGPVGILIGAGVGALTSKEKKYCVCPGCGHMWEYKLPQ